MTSDLETDSADEGVGPDEEVKERLNLDVSVEEPNACQRHVTVTVSREDIDRYFDEALGEMMPNANVPGFRPGRAPKKLVESHFKKDLTGQIKGSLLLDSMTQVTEDQQFSAISEPDFDYDAVDIPDEGSLTFEFDIEVRPEFQLPKWKGLKLEKPVEQTGKAEVDEYLQTTLHLGSVLEPVEGAAQPGDYLVVNIDFSRDGKSINTAEELTVPLRNSVSFADGMLDGFDKLMKGAKAGDKKSSTMELSENAAVEALRGEEVAVEIELLDVKRMQSTEISPETLAKFGIDNEGELRDQVAGILERQLVYKQQQHIRKQITQSLTESASWELPPDLLERQANRELERTIMELRRSGFSDDQIRAHTNSLRQNSKRSTATALKEHFILERIAEEEEIDADEKDFAREIALIAAQSGDSARSVRARIEKRGQTDVLRNQIIERKVLDLIMQNATFKEVAAKSDEQTVSGVDFSISGRAKANIPDAKYGGDERDLQQPADRT